MPWKRIDRTDTEKRDIRSEIRKEAQERRRQDKEERNSQRADKSTTADYGPLPIWISKDRKEVTLDLQGQNLDDDKLAEVLTPHLRHKLWLQLCSLHPEAHWHYINVNISNNSIGPKGAAALITFLHNCRQYEVPLHARILKLHRNKLGDDGVLQVAQLVMMQAQPIHEIHLSHNQITGTGAAALLIAFGSMQQWGAYPFQAEDGQSCRSCRCRLENNAIKELEGLIDVLQEGGDVHIGRTSLSREAEKSSGTSESTPHVVLPIVDKKSSYEAQGTKLDGIMIRMWAREELKKLLTDAICSGSLDGVEDYVLVNKRFKEVTLNLQGHGLDDALLAAKLTPQLRDHILKQLMSVRPGAKWHYVNVNLSNNYLGPEGVAVLGSFFHDFHRKNTPLYIRVLKIHRNNLGDGGAWRLAHLVLTQPRPIHEIHLSHNQVTAAGAAALLLAFGSLQQWAVYPFRRSQTTDQYVPSLCRLEMNEIGEPNNLIDLLQQSGNVRIGKNSTDSMVDWVRKPQSWKSVHAAPHVTLHMLDKQFRSSSQAQVDLSHIVTTAQTTIQALLSNSADTYGMYGIGGLEACDFSLDDGSGYDYDDFAAWQGAGWPDDLTAEQWADPSVYASDKTTGGLRADAAVFVPAGSDSAKMTPRSVTPQTTAPSSPEVKATPKFRADAPEFRPHSNSFTESAASWPSPSGLCADAPEFVPTFPLLSSPATQKLSPRTALLTLSGAWGALCSNIAADGAILPEGCLVRAELLQYRFSHKNSESAEEIGIVLADASIFD